MRLTLGSTIAALKAQRQLERTSADQARVFERLSSGLRINRASDDPAGLAIASSLRADSRVFSQALSNINDGISFLTVTASGLSNLSSIVERQRELAQQAANGVYSTVQRAALDNEAQALAREYNRIIQSTSFNGISIFNADSQALTIQAGYSAISLAPARIDTFGERVVGTGAFEAGVDISMVTPGGSAGRGVVGDFNGDSFLDIAAPDDVSSTLRIRLGNGDGTFKAHLVADTLGSQAYDLWADDVNGDGRDDLFMNDRQSDRISVLLANTDGSFPISVDYGVVDDALDVFTADMNNDGRIDLVAANGAQNKIDVLLGNGDGTFKASISSAATSPDFLRTGDFNSDGFTDVAYVTGGTNVLLGFGDGTGALPTGATLVGSASGTGLSVSDLNGDGFLDLVAAVSGANKVEVHLGNGNGTFKSAVSYAAAANTFFVITSDFNGDNRPDIASLAQSSARLDIFLNNGDGTFAASVSYTTGATPTSVQAGDFNSDGVNDLYVLQMGAGTAGIFLGIGNESGGGNVFSLLTQQDARNALQELESVSNQIQSATTQVGASQSRLDVAFSAIMALRGANDQALARITDIDVAEEATKLVRLSILQRAAVAILAQSTKDQSLVLALLS